MEKAVVSRSLEEADAEADARKLPVMRALAKTHGCDVETLLRRIDASELDLYDTLKEMVSRREVEPSRRGRENDGGSNREKYILTLRGWAEYMRVLASIYELPE